MKKILWMIVGMFGGILPLASQTEQARHLFVNMPDTLSMELTGVNRADCVDFLESKMRACVTNRFNETSEMTDLTDDYIRLELSAKSSWQMKVLPLSDTLQVICTVNTYCAPACDSRIRFYSTDWKELDASRFLEGMPESVSDFVSADAGELPRDFGAWMKQADMLLMQADLNGKEQTLQILFTTPDYMDKETAEKLEPYLCRMKKLVWRNGRFSPCTAE